MTPHSGWVGSLIHSTHGIFYWSVRNAARGRQGKSPIFTADDKRYPPEPFQLAEPPQRKPPQGRPGEHRPRAVFLRCPPPAHGGVCLPGLFAANSNFESRTPRLPCPHATSRDQVAVWSGDGRPVGPKRSRHHPLDPGPSRHGPESLGTAHYHARHQPTPSRGR